MAPIPTSGAARIARNTGNNSTGPERHADPVDAPTAGKRPGISVPTCPTKLTLRVSRNRSMGWPFRTT
jgi:hypothetical protein